MIRTPPISTLFPYTTLFRSKRVDLLIGRHRPELRGKRRAGPARHHDGRHDAADLAGHRDGHQVRDVDRGAELLELHGSDEAEDEPDQEADEADDAERSRPALLDDGEQVDDPEARAAAHQCTEGDNSIPEERESYYGPGPGGSRLGPNPHEPRGPLTSAPGVPFRNRLSQAQEALDAVRESRAIGQNAARGGIFEHF